MKDLLKFITCGSVDDGKSTLIGHMLYDAKLLFADQARALELDSRVGSREGHIDYSLLLDGLMAEREQGITIDVAYRYFSTEKRSFIVADTPGHEEYTRNMAVGASFADLAIILVDATKGIISQTKRHTRICSLMGIQHVVLAVNKMDLIQFDEARFNAIKEDFLSLTQSLPIKTVKAIPVSATDGDNITKMSSRTGWYKGTPLLTYLNEVEVAKNADDTFIMPVQRVSRPNQNFRGFQGQIESGELAVGDTVTVLPTKESAKVKGILVTDKATNKAVSGQPVTIQLETEIDVSRGDVLTTSTTLKQSNRFVAKLLWMDDTPLYVGASYLIKLGTKVVPGTVTQVQAAINIHSGQLEAVKEVGKNELVICELLLSEDIVFDAFEHTEALGSFILMNRLTNMTAACGVIESELLAETNNVQQQAFTVTRTMRANQKQQQPLTIWLTGLSGSGKSTLANELEKLLVTKGYHTMVLDGDNVRLGLNKDLAFSDADRTENIRRVAEVANLMNDAGIITIVSFISPFEADRALAKSIIGDSFIEVHISTPIEECEKRDVKGLYEKARNGEIVQFTGVSSPYEIPTSPHVRVNTANITIKEAVDQLVEGISTFL